MAKLDPIISEFESDEAAEAYDVWFRAQVEAGMASTKPRIPHSDVMARVRKTIAEKRDASARLGN
jgi:hypothetical protein